MAAAESRKIISSTGYSEKSAAGESGIGPGISWHQRRRINIENKIIGVTPLA